MHEESLKTIELKVKEFLQDIKDLEHIINEIVDKDYDHLMYALLSESYGLSYETNENGEVSSVSLRKYSTKFTLHPECLEVTYYMTRDVFFSGRLDSTIEYISETLNELFCILGDEYKRFVHATEDEKPYLQSLRDFQPPCTNIIESYNKHLENHKN